MTKTSQNQIQIKTLTTLPDFLGFLCQFLWAILSSFSETSNILGIDHETRLFQSSIPIARSRHTRALFQGCVRVSSSCRGGFLCEINT